MGKNCETKKNRTKKILCIDDFFSFASSNLQQMEYILKKIKLFEIVFHFFCFVREEKKFSSPKKNIKTIMIKEVFLRFT